jgi:phosphate transport system substrate-binding protein
LIINKIAEKAKEDHMKVKQFISAFLTVVIVTAFIPPLNARAATATVSVDGFEIATETIAESGKTLVPFKFFEDAIGAIAAYNAKSKQISIKTAANSFTMAVDKKNYTLNGKTARMDVAPMLIDGVPYVQIDIILDGVGAEVGADIASNTISISYFTDMSGPVKLTGSTTLQPIAMKAADFLNGVNKKLNVSVAGGGSGTGISDTKNGVNNIGMSSRKLTDDELKDIKHVIPVALDAIAVIVNPDNPVDNLTTEQAKQIFTGEIKNWNEVGGADAPILIQTRETGSGTLQTLIDLLLGSGNSVAVAATPHTSSELIKQAVAGDKNAVGFDSVGFVDSSVKALSLNNVAPNKETVESGAYAMGRLLYVLSKGRPSGASAKFIDFLRARECQEKFVIEENFLSIR